MKIENITNFAVECRTKILDLELSLKYTEFPLVMSIDYEKKTKAFHTHQYFEFIIVKRANNLFFETEKEKIPLFPGQIVIVPPQTVHKFTNIEEGNCGKIAVNFQGPFKQNDSIFKKFFIEFCKSKEYIIVQKSDELNNIISLLEFKSELKEIQLEGFFNLVCVYLYNKYMPKKMSTKTNKAQIYDIEDAINNALVYYYNKNLTAKDISKQVYLSERQINRICQKKYHKTYKEQVTYLRIEYAKELLKSTTKSITDIAYSCGFGSSSAFTIAFKKECKIGPKEFRKITTIHKQY